MEGKRRSVKRTLHRKHVVSRMEEELWAFVYEHLWPWTVPKNQPSPRPVRVRAKSPSSASAFAQGA
jgi:hypothetical protein